MTEDMAMRNEFLDEIGDTLFAVAVAGAIGAIGLRAANLAIQVRNEPLSTLLPQATCSAKWHIRNSGVRRTRAPTNLPVS